MLHVANSLLLLSFVLKDILWLRLLNVAASFCFITFFYTRPNPMWAAIAWNLLFTSVNLYQIVVLFLERRPVYLTEEEQFLHHGLFPSISTREFAKLLQLAEWEVHESDEPLQVITQGQETDCVLLLSLGQMLVVLDEEKKVFLERGQFAGEMSFLTGGDATADVVVQTNTRYLRWNRCELQDFFDKQPNLYAAMQLAWSNDLVRKLKTV